MAGYLYTDAGDGRYEPTGEAGSPWSTTTQHGGPVNALFMRAVQRETAGSDLRVTRLTVDILKPVPLAPLDLGVNVVRRGRRLGLLDAVLSDAASGAPVAVCRAVVLKDRPDQAALFPPAAAEVPGPEACADAELISRERRETGPPGFHLGIRMRRGAGDQTPVTWFTWPQALVDGEAVSPAQRCAAICDLTTIVSGRLHLSGPGGWDNRLRFEMLNTDTTVHLFRPPLGEWFGLAGNFIADHAGTGVAEAVLYDETGCLGRTVQTVASNA